MSPEGHPVFGLPDDVGAVVVGRFEMSFGVRFEAHAHPVHQLAWCERGVLAVSVGHATWVLPPTRALWIPCGIVHAVEASRPATMSSVYFRKRACPVRWTVPTVVAATPIFRELVRYLARDDVGKVARGHARALLFSTMKPQATTTLDVPPPSDPRARRVMDALLADPADDRDLAAFGRLADASTRTLGRIFQAETEMSFGKWRTQLRLRAALVHLAEGQAIATVAERVGYRSASAFVAAFHQELGTSPGRYFADR